MASNMSREPTSFSPPIRKEIFFYLVLATVISTLKADPAASTNLASITSAAEASSSSFSLVAPSPPDLPSTTLITTQ